jgi:hypothetical protein
MYAWNVFKLWATRKINWPTAIYALKERPIAVCGRDGAYQVSERI